MQKNRIFLQICTKMAFNYSVSVFSQNGEHRKMINSKLSKIPDLHNSLNASQNDLLRVIN